MEGALKRFDTEVHFVLYPLVLNANATSEVATQAAWCAGEQGKFWEFHRLLHARQTDWYRLSDPLNRLLEWAPEVQVDSAALKSCVRSGRMKQFIEADKNYGRSLQVQSTPTLFINEQRIVGAQSEADIVRTIRRELARAQRSSP